MGLTSAQRTETNRFACNYQTVKKMPHFSLSLTKKDYQVPLVSVVIPVYNGDRFIGQAIESVLSQTYSPLEIIVIDDGSTDQTEQALAPYLHQIQYLTQPNQGSAAARNSGLCVATGELIAFLDADDFFFPLRSQTR